MMEPSRMYSAVYIPKKISQYFAVLPVHSERDPQ